MLDAERSIVGANAAAHDSFGPLDGSGPVGDLLDLRGPTGRPVLRDAWLDLDGEIELSFTPPGATEVHASVTIAYQREGEAITGAVLCARPVGDKSGIAIVSTVSHELRSPLTSVKGYTSLMINRWDRLGDEQKKMMLEQVHTDADRVTRLVTELLDISRLETGRLVLRRQLVDVAELAGTVVEKVGMAYPDLDCTLHFPEEFPRVYADPDKVQQVLTNLVENAAKYGDPVGMTIDARVAEDHVAVSVTDKGEGIPAEDLPRVFTKFFRRDHGKPTGTGLGLWISRGLAEAHGGELEATSTVGQGSTFTFTLPLGTFEELNPIS